MNDPTAVPPEAEHEYGIVLTSWDDLPIADAMVVAVSHEHYLSMPLANLFSKLKPGGVFVDVKSAYSSESITAAGYSLWRL